ncbi:MAG: DUF4956 domain-containing protein, partial [Desulfuromonadales bacterium]|nr:DUF4956 domain-containing protein [Desulfuromonadales bacterium]
VGALSVVRFRTPIKEPEELVYLFLAIALGLGYGAGQIVVTSMVFVVIVLLIIFFLSRKSVRFENEFNLVVEWADDSVDIDKIISVVRGYANSLELSKFGSTKSQSSAFFKVVLKEDISINAFGDEMRGLGDSVSYSLYEARVLH